MLRLWAASHDTDKNVSITSEALADSNQRVKLFRHICKQLLGNLYEYKVAEQSLDFAELNRLDQMMKVLLAEHLQSQRQTMDQRLDVRGYIRGIEEFSEKYVDNFYLEVAKDRLMYGQGTKGFLSAQSTILDILNCLVVEASPVLIHTSQEVFQHMPASLFSATASKPLTIFQLPWPSPPTSPAFQTLLANFALRANFLELLALRSKIKPQMRELAEGLRQDQSAFDLTFIVRHPDSPTAAILESVLEGDELSELFFGCRIGVATADQDDAERRTS